MPRSRDTIRAATLCVPVEVSAALAAKFPTLEWAPVSGRDWVKTRVLVSMIPENRVGGCLLGASRGEPITDGTPHQNDVVTAARRAVGKWLNTPPVNRSYETKASFQARMDLKAWRAEEFEAVGRLALGGSAWVRPLENSGNRKPRTAAATPASNTGGGLGRGGFRAREYFVLRLGDLGPVYVGRNSRYGRVIENQDIHASPPAQWDISAEFVRVEEPIGGTLEARLRDLEKEAGPLRPYVTALRAYAAGLTSESWQKLCLAHATTDHGFRKDGSRKTPKRKGDKFGEALMCSKPVPIYARKKVDGWWVAADRL